MKSLGWNVIKPFSIFKVTIDDLIPGSRYKFRIKSENSYGISEPGEESDPFDVGGVSSDRFVIVKRTLHDGDFLMKSNYYLQIVAKKALYVMWLLAKGKNCVIYKNVRKDMTFESFTPDKLGKIMIKKNEDSPKLITELHLNSDIDSFDVS